MTEIRSGQTTGADLNQELRRRNVPTQGGSNGTISKPPEADDTKKAQKVRACLPTNEQVLTHLI